MVLRTGKTLSSETMFVAMLALIATQVTVVKGESFWAYVPKPPLLHPVGWNEQDHIKVMTNNSELLGGLQDFDRNHHISKHVNYVGRSDTVPICLALKGAAPFGCLPVNYRSFLTDSPDREGGFKCWIWKL